MRAIYRDRATIEQDSSTDDTAPPDYSGQVFMTDWPCKINTIGGDETYRGRMLEGHVTHVVEGQYIDGVTPTMRLRITAGSLIGKYLNVRYSRSVDYPGRATSLEIQCQESAGR